MPNWVMNRLKIEGVSMDEVIRLHVRKDEYGKEQFDFNTILKMPEELKIEKSSRSQDGLKLYIASLNPLLPDFGNKEEKCQSIKDFAKKLMEAFDEDIMNSPRNYLLKGKEIKDAKEKYQDKLSEVIELGKKVFHNLSRYGFADWYDWSIENWGTKWNTTNTKIDEDGNLVFDTAWTPPFAAMEELSKMHPDWRITHSFAEEQIGFYAGKDIYIEGEKAREFRYKEFSKEAYELSFELWGGAQDFWFNEEKGTYEYIGTCFEED